MYIITILAIAGIHRAPTRSVYILHNSGLLPSATSRKGINSMSATTESGVSVRCIKGEDAGQKNHNSTFFPAVTRESVILFASGFKYS